MNKLLFFVFPLIIYLSGCSLFEPSDYSLSKFDSAQWIEYGTEGENIRYEMINDLFNKHLSIGLKKEIVNDLLGTPDYINESGNEYSYYLGWPPNSGSFMRIDGEVLSIFFQNDVVKDYYHYES